MMASSMSEEKERDTKNTIEKQPEEKVDETAATTTTEENRSTSTASEPESSKKKKRKKKDFSATAEAQKAGDDNGKDVKENRKDVKEKTSVKNSTNTQNNTKVEEDALKESNSARYDLTSGPVVSVTKRTRPPYKYDPEKVTLRFLFANRDGLTVTVECKPSDTVGEVKGQLLSVWPEDLQSCSSGDQLRLICMGKGMLIPDTRTLEDCEVPVFKTHPTPVNVAVRPKANLVETFRNGKDGITRGGGGPSGGSNHRTTEQSGQGCGCVIS